MRTASKNERPEVIDLHIDAGRVRRYGVGINGGSDTGLASRDCSLHSANGDET